MRISGAVSTKQGKSRVVNEDSIGFFPELRLFVVADGLGGHMRGKMASELAVSAMQQCLQTLIMRRSHLDNAITDLVEPASHAWHLLSAIHYANAQVFAASRHQLNLVRMGTTLTSLHFDEQQQWVSLGHVGDTRAYRIRDGALAQLTEDHSFEQQLLKARRLDKQSLPTFPYRHKLTQAVGICSQIEPTVRVEKLKTGDLFLLVTNGAHQEMSEETVLKCVYDAGANLQQLCNRLTDLADENGGDDKTVLAVRYDISPETSPLEWTFPSPLPVK